jgi:hypothetical protein
MAAVLPVFDDAGMNRKMAINTFGRCFADWKVSSSGISGLKKNNSQTNQYTDNSHDNLLILNKK